MAKRVYPHINDTSFPDLETINTYKYENNVDYDAYTDSVKVTLLNVSWCGDYDNVVYWESKSQRDQWFQDEVGRQNPPTREMPTMFRLYEKGNIKVDITIDDCMNYNYVMIEYGRLPNQNTDTGNQTLYYFIDDMEQESPNTTRLYLHSDMWNNYIYDMNITYVNLERGHAPMASSSVNTYLSNPIDNNEYLLSDDVNYGELSRVASSSIVPLNDDCYFCVFTTVDLSTSSTFGSKSNGNWTIPNTGTANISGTPSPFCFVMENNSAVTFLNGLDSAYPQVKPTIQTTAFIDKELITVGTGFNFAGVTIYKATQKKSTKNIVTLSKEMFGFDTRYSDVTKLYTYPYSAIELTDGEGKDSLIKIEDTTGQLKLETVANILYPFINIQGTILGVGGTSVKTISFENASSYSQSVQGTYYKYLYSWDVPCFAVTQANSVTNDYSGYYDREQSKTSYTNANASSLASNQTAYSNAIDSNNTSLTNTLASNSTSLSNSLDSNSNGYNNAIRSAASAKNNSIDAATASSTNSESSRNLLQKSNTLHNGYIEDSYKVSWKKQALNLSNGIAASNIRYLSELQQEHQGYFASAFSNTANIVPSVISGKYGDAVAGGVGSVFDGINVMVNSSIDEVANNNLRRLEYNYFKELYGLTSYVDDLGITINGTYGQMGMPSRMTRDCIEGEQGLLSASYNINNTAVNRTFDSATSKTNTSLVSGGNYDKFNADGTSSTSGTFEGTANRSYEASRLNAVGSKTTADTNSNRSKTTSDANANRSKATGDSNALRSKNTADANAGRSLNTCQSAVSNQIKSANIKAPNMWGSTQDSTSTTKPSTLVANIITQSKSAIRQTAEQFLRYGYMLNMEWEVSTFNVMPKFSYWKCNAVYCSDDGLFEGAQRAIQEILMNGTTVWKDPNQIGNTSIYSNK